MLPDADIEGLIRIMASPSEETDMILGDNLLGATKRESKLRGCISQNPHTCIMLAPGLRFTGTYLQYQSAHQHVDRTVRDFQEIGYFRTPNSRCYLQS